MYTAIQARNIAKEKYNHWFYHEYKYHIKYLMRGIAKNAKYGKFEYQYSVYDTHRMTYAVIKQIMDELQNYGYKYDISTEVSKHNKKYFLITVQWND